MMTSRETARLYRRASASAGSLWEKQSDKNDKLQRRAQQAGARRTLNYPTTTESGEWRVVVVAECGEETEANLRVRVRGWEEGWCGEMRAKWNVLDNFCGTIRASNEDKTRAGGEWRGTGCGRRGRRRGPWLAEGAPSIRAVPVPTGLNCEEYLFRTLVQKYCKHCTR
ncbi:hypothetical protein J6590_073026 [Homalodisca vitripennis]|nr:hypothetical protein J6590_073026 [Homalodisca vitripennis]